MHARRSRRPSALLAPAAALLLLAFTAACDDDDDPGAPAPTAQLRFFHTAPGTGAVTFRVDGAALASNVELAAAPSGYVTVNAGARALTVRTAAGTTDLATETATLKADMPHTVILSKDGTGVDLVVLADTNTAPAAGKAKLRLVHAAPSAAAAVDVYVTAPGADLAAATPTATNVAYEAASKYLELAAGTYQIRFTATGTKTVALDAGEVTLTAGQIRTTAALDAAAGGTPLRAVVIQDKNP